MIKRKIPWLFLTAMALLLIPYLAMFFTDEVQWTLPDFAVAAVLLFGTAGSYKVIMRTIKNRKSRIVLVIGLLTGLLLLWLELAVGLFNSPLAGG